MQMRQHLLWTISALISGFSSQAIAADGLTGAQIYMRQCASCHGKDGEGAKDYPLALEGDRSVEQLTKYIDKRMPEEAPGKCVGEDARKVAVYIHDAFYSQAARDRKQAPRVQLARLTVDQHRNAVADLIGSFRSESTLDDRHGLRGGYYPSRRIGGRSRATLDRVDAVIDFDFKMGSPDPKINAEEFAIQWRGAVFAPETGEYEFSIRSGNGARLWVNDSQRPLIDAWVRSGVVNDEKGTIHLLGGRHYPIRLEFFKSKQAKEQAASISLRWKPPHGQVEIIPSKYLSPARVAETFILQTPFPPDDRSLGWERGTTISKAWDQSTTNAAFDTADYVDAHLDELAGTERSASDRTARLKEFCRRFVERAIRRPLSDAEKRFFVDAHFDGGADVKMAVKRVVLLALKSPRFLYIDPADTPHAIASRLSFALWDAPPDKELLAAAASGELATREQIARQAERMLGHPAARLKLKGFFRYWLDIEHAVDLAKDPARYPDFSPEMIADLRTSLDLFLDEVVWGEGSDFRQLFLRDKVHLNDRLARYYGAKLSDGSPFQEVQLDPGKRAGVVTHPYMLTRFAYTASSSPIHRGVFLSRGVLGVALRPPPEAFTPLPEDLHPDLTTRQRVALQTKPASCQSCHTMINSLGFTLEQFDAVGRFREKERGKPVDSTGEYTTRSGKSVKFAGPVELARFLAGSEEVHAAFAQQVFQHVAKQPVRAYGSDTLDHLRTTFAASDFNIRKLVTEAAVISAIGPRKKPPGSDKGG